MHNVSVQSSWRVMRRRHCTTGAALSPMRASRRGNCPRPPIAQKGHGDEYTRSFSHGLIAGKQLDRGYLGSHPGGIKLLHELLINTLDRRVNIKRNVITEQ